MPAYAQSPCPSRVAFAEPSRSRQTSVVVCQAAKSSPSTVRISILGRRLPVTDAIKEYVETKISRAITHFAQELKSVDVTLSARGGDTGTQGPKEQKVDVTIHTLRNGVVRVEDSEATLYASIDIVCDKIERKLTKVKERAIVKGKWPGRAGPREAGDKDFDEYMKDVIYETKVFEQEEALRAQFKELNTQFPKEVRRNKVVTLDPMSVDEAIEALEAVGHDFYVFWEAESNGMQIVYRRQAGGYGVLVPKKRE